MTAAHGFSTFTPSMLFTYFNEGWRAIGRIGTDKKEYKIFLIKEIQMGSGAKSYVRNSSLTYEEIRQFFTLYEEAVSHI
jgi:hypothetical protein